MVKHIFPQLERVDGVNMLLSCHQSLRPHQGFNGHHALDQHALCNLFRIRRQSVKIHF